MEKNGVTVEVLRPVDYQIAAGVYADITEHGWERDDWPGIYEKVKAAHILVITSPIWLGEKSSVCTKAIERLYAASGQLNEHGQYAYYGRVDGCPITGNEDEAKHCAMNILYSLSHLGFIIPPQADAAWLGKAGPGPAYLDPGSGGPENDFTNRNTTFMTWNLLHLARMITDAGGIPAHGNQRSLWAAGCRFDHPNRCIDNRAKRGKGKSQAQQALISAQRPVPTVLIGPAVRSFREGGGAGIAIDFRLSTSRGQQRPPLDAPWLR